MSGYYIRNETSRSQVIRLDRGNAIVLRPKGFGSTDTAYIPSDSAEDQGVMSAIFRGAVSKVTKGDVATKKSDAVAERTARIEAAKESALSVVEEPVDAIVQVQCSGIKTDGKRCGSKISVPESVKDEPQYCARHAVNADAGDTEDKA